MSAYLDLPEFRARTVMPSADVDIVEALHPGFLDSRLAVHTSKINVRLRKRYAVPFAAPVPEIVLGWLVALVTLEAYQKRGWNPGDAQSAQIEAASNDARDELKEAADGDDGLLDLPLREDTTVTGITQGGPFSYAEPSPYDWVDAQAEAIRGR